MISSISGLKSWPSTGILREVLLDRIHVAAAQPQNQCIAHAHVDGDYKRQVISRPGIEANLSIGLEIEAKDKCKVLKTSLA